MLVLDCKVASQKASRLLWGDGGGSSSSGTIMMITQLVFWNIPHSLTVNKPLIHPPRGP